MSKRVKRPADKAAGRKKQRKAAADGDGGEDAGFFLLGDEDKQQRRGGGGEEESDDEEAQETAEEKRLRLARAYLDEMRDDGGGDDDEGDEDDEERRGVTGGRDRLTARLQQDAAEAQGRLHLNLAHRISVPDQTRPARRAPSSDSESDDESEDGDGGAAAAAAAAHGGGGALPYGAGRFAPAHDASATAVALSQDGETAFTVGKDGSIFKWDVEAMRKVQLLRPGGSRPVALEPEAADWVRKRGGGKGAAKALYAAALSSDGRFLAVGGGDRKVHVFDAAGGQHVASYPGHRDVISGLAFREGGHTLFSASFDRTVKIWSVDDGAYVDTLFGHQAEVYAVDVLRQERAVSCGHDHTARVWKVQEESHLIFRAHHPALECCRYITGTEWLSGADDGSLQVWTQLKKKPVSVVRGAHRREGPSGGGGRPPAAGSWATANSEAAAWVQSVALARGSDFAASGAGDGAIRLWAVEQSKHGGAGGLRPVGELPALGFVNGLAVDRRGRFVAAALGCETRLGRWGRVEGAANGLLVHPLEVAPEEDE
ncbi:MAG: WD40-repeat-containing domain protein [Monoraphidium minutum]|nr:MAG: WD40-repeat-containing domain protein [Monoraphidium minutum]